MVAAVSLRLAALLCVLWVQSATAGWGKGGKGNWGSKDWHGGRWGHGKHQWQGHVNSQSGIETGLAIAQFLDGKKRQNLAVENPLRTPQLVPHHNIGARTERSKLQREKSTKSWKNSGLSVMLP